MSRGIHACADEKGNGVYVAGGSSPMKCVVVVRLMESTWICAIVY
jgi:hypothetical protein